VVVLATAAAACSGGAGSDGRAALGGPTARDGSSASSASSAEAGVSLVATADERGSFSTPCAYSHSLADDPIVHTGHAGMSHRHDFFGATTTDASSDAESLLAGATTCRSAADRSAYWAPSLLAAGRPVEPAGVIAYYRVPVGADAHEVEIPPNGLEMIAGDGTATSVQPPSVVQWRCGFAPEASAVPVRCAAGMDLRLLLTFDPCWNGSDLRSPDHRSHLAPLGPSGGCPASHPVLLPELTLEVRYDLDGTAGELGLDSGPVTGGHGDALLAWDEDHMAGEVDTCLRANRSCDVVSETSRLGFDQLG